MRGGAPGRSLQRDRRGNIHVMEVLIVVGVVTMGMFTVTQMQQRMVRPEETSHLADQAELESALTVLTQYAAIDDHARYSHRAEAWHVAAARDGTDERLRDWMARAIGPGGYQAHLNVEGHTVSALGTDPHLRAATAADHPYLLTWGTTHITPSMSHINPSQSLDVTVHPLASTDVWREGSYPYEVQVTTRGGATTYQSGTYDALRVAPNDDRVVNTPAPSFHVPGETDTPQNLVQAAPVETAWPVHVRLDPSQPDAGAFPERGTLLRLEVPHPWQVVDHSVRGWTQLGAHPEDSSRYAYDGPRTDGDPVWFNATLTRAEASPILVTQAVRVTIEAPGYATAHQVRVTTPHDRYSAPVVHVAHTGPLVVGATRDLVVRVTNPTAEPLTLEGLGLRLPARLGTVLNVHIDAGRLVSREGVHLAVEATEDAVRLDILPSPERSWVVAPGAQFDVTLPLQAAATTSDLQHRADPVWLTHGAPDGAQAQVAAERGRHIGGYTLTMPETADLGVHSLRVLPDLDAALPPGMAGYEVLAEPVAALDDIQDARRTMALDVTPRIASPDEPLLATLDLGSLPQALKDLEEVDPDGVSLRLRAGDMWSQLSGEDLVDETVPLNLDAAPPVIGMVTVDTNQDGVEEVVVAYDDGHLVALEGASLADQDGYRHAAWRTDLRGQITGGPVLVDVDGVPGAELVVGMRAVGQHPSLVVLDLQGNVVDRVSTRGLVEQLVPWRCDGIDRGVAWASVNLADRDPRYGPIPATRHTDIQSEGQSVSSVYLRAWSPGGGEISGPPHPNVDVVRLRAGEFAPWGHCGFVYVLEDGSLHHRDASGSTLRSVYSLSDADVRDVWVTNVTHTALEAEMGVAGDDLVVWRGDGTWEVVGAYAPRLAVPEVSVPLVSPTDELVAMSWVDSTHGWLVSAEGWMYQTTDGGESFELATSGPVVRAPRQVADLVYGSGGMGMVLDDAGIGHELDPTGQATGKSFNLVYHFAAFQFVEWGEHPALIGRLVSQDTVHLFEWVAGSFQQREVVLPCPCDEVQGNPAATLGADGGRLFDASGRLADRVTAQSLDRGLSGVIVWNTTGKVQRLAADGTVEAEMENPIEGSITSDRTDGAAMAYAESKLLVEPTVKGASPVLLRNLTQAINHVATGPGPRLLIHDASLSGVATGASHVFRVGGLLPEGEARLVPDPATARPDATWRLVTPNTVTGWQGIDEALAVPVGSPLLLELRDDSAGVDWSPTLTSPQGDYIVATNCVDACLQVVGDAGSSVRPNQWSVAAGLLAQGTHDATWRPMVVETAEGPVVVAEEAEGAVARSLATGLRLDAQLIEVSDSVLDSATGQVGSTEWVWWQHLGATPEEGDTDQIVGLQADAGGGLHVWSPVHGGTPCWVDEEAFVAEVTRALEAPGGFVFGFSDGRVALVDAEACAVRWMAPALETGARFAIALPPSPRGLIGPYVVQVDVELDVATLDDLVLSLSDVVVLSTLAGEAERVAFASTQLVVYDG